MDDMHDNVIRLALHRDIISRLVLWLLNILPQLQTYLSTAFPDCLLPPTVILKQMKVGWDEEFNQEKQAYQRLRRLQGTVIPRCYGEAKYRGTRALVLSDVGGMALNDDNALTLEPAHLRQMIEASFQAIHRSGISPGDFRLDNLHYVKDRIVVLDFEHSWDIYDDEDPMVFTKRYTDHVMHQYQTRLKAM